MAGGDFADGEFADAAPLAHGGALRTGCSARPLAVGVVAAGLAFALTYVWWSWRVVATAVPGGLVIENFDSYTYYYPMFEYAFRELGQGRFPFWNPYQHCGTPFFATAQHLLLSPLNVFFLVMPTAAALRATTLLHLTLGLLFTYFRGRVSTLLGRRRRPRPSPSSSPLPSPASCKCRIISTARSGCPYNSR